MSLRANNLPVASPEEVRVLVDTGASTTFVQKSVLDKLGVSKVGEQHAHTVSTGETPESFDAYTVQLFFPGLPDGVLASGLRVLAAQDLSGLDVDVLLGCDVLTRCLLFYNGPEGDFTIAFDYTYMHPR